MATIQELVFRISASSDQLSRELAKSNSAVSGFANSVNGSLDKVQNNIAGLGKSFDGITDAIGGFRTALGALGVSVGLREVGDALVDAALKYDRLNTQLQFGVGTVAGAKQAYADLQGLTDRLGLSFDATARSFASFSAATRGTALQGAETAKIFDAVAEAAATLKLSADDTEGVFLALSQMVSKGTVQAEELRGQLGERLPGAFNLFAKAIGVSTQELGKMLQQGQIVASDALPKFADELHETFGVTAVAAADSASASVTRLSNAWDRLLTTMSSSSATKDGADFLTGMTNTINQILVNEGRTDKIEAGMEARADVDNLNFALAKAKEYVDYLNKNHITGELVKDAVNQVAELNSELEAAKIKRDSFLAPDINQTRHGASGTVPQDATTNTAPAASKELTDHLRNLNLQLDAFSQTDRQQAISKALSGFENTAAVAQITKLAGAIYDANQALNAFNQDVADEAKSDQDLLSRAQTVIKAVQLPIDAYKDSIRNLTELRSQDEISQDQYNRAVTQAARTAFPEAMAAIDNATGSLQGMRDTVEQLNEALNAGVISQDDWNKAVDKLADTSKAGKSAAQELKDVSQDAGHAISTSFEDAVIQGQTLNSVLKGLLQTLAQIALRVGVTKPLEGFLGGILSHLTDSGGLSKSIDQMIADNPDIFATGGIMSSKGKLPLNHYAGGGIARSAQLAVYGEGSNPEAIVPLPDGRAIPVNLKGGKGGSGDFIINAPITVNGGGGSDYQNADLAKQIQKQVIPTIKQVVDQRLVDQSRSGGYLNRGGPR